MSIEDMRAAITASLKEMIGVSTISFGGISVEQAVDAVAEAGFGTIEMLMSVDRMGAIGYPEPLPASCWMYPDNVDKGQRQRIREKLKQFTYVTAHVQLLDSNIASLNPGIREESVRQYLACIDLAHDLGIPLITFHYGCIHRAGYPGIGLDESMKYNREFLDMAADRAEECGLFMGYECLGPEGPRIVELVRDAGRERFGIHVDVMWTTSAIGREGLTRLVDAAAAHIVEVHVHGGLRRSDGATAHLPLRVNNVVDFPGIMPRIRNTGFKGPFIFEIASSENVDSVIRDCRESKELLLGYLGEG